MTSASLLEPVRSNYRTLHHRPILRWISLGHFVIFPTCHHSLSPRRVLLSRQFLHFVCRSDIVHRAAPMCTRARCSTFPHARRAMCIDQSVVSSFCSRCKGCELTCDVSKFLLRYFCLISGRSRDHTMINDGRKDERRVRHTAA